MNGDVELHFVPTKYQLTYLFKNPLDESRFNILISELRMLNIDYQINKDQLYLGIQNEMIQYSYLITNLSLEYVCV